jgi:hypothetical protein
MIEMDSIAIEKHFTKIIDEDKNMSNGIAAIKTLLLVLEKTNCKFHSHFIISIGFQVISMITFSAFSLHNSRAREHNQISCNHTEKLWKTNHIYMLCKRIIHLFHYSCITQTGRQNNG